MDSWAWIAVGSFAFAAAMIVSAVLVYKNAKKKGR